jgi:hypothetical protein
MDFSITSLLSAFGNATFSQFDLTPSYGIKIEKNVPCSKKHKIFFSHITASTPLTEDERKNNIH